jgi:hypothetical protein
MATSTTPLALLTPIMSQKARMASGGVAAAAQARDRGHARVVPAV